MISGIVISILLGIIITLCVWGYHQMKWTATWYGNALDKKNQEIADMSVKGIAFHEKMSVAVGSKNTIISRQDEALISFENDISALNDIHDEYVDRSTKDIAFLTSILTATQLDKWTEYKIKRHTNNGKVKCVVVMRKKFEFGSALNFLDKIGDVIETVGIRATVVIPVSAIITVASMKSVDHLESITGELLITTR